MHTIYPNTKWPESGVLDELREMATATLSDAMGRQNSMSHAMKPLWNGARLCGRALTVKTYPCDNLMVHKAMQVACPGDVLVIQAGGIGDGAIWGELLTRSAQVHGLEGVVIDGAARDAERIEALRFAVFCTAVLPGGTHKVNPGSINVPVCVGGAVVMPGDIVLGDADGVVVIPGRMEREVLGAARQIVAKEIDMMKRLENGELIFDILDLQPLLERANVQEICGDDSSALP